VTDNFFSTREDTHITFCVLTFKKTPWLKRCLSSIQRYCETDYSVKVLTQGPTDAESEELMGTLRDDRFEIITSPVNLGSCRGRNLLARRVKSSLMMMLDDDVYLTDGSIAAALDVLQKNPSVGAVSMPQYNLRGSMIVPGGNNLIIRGGVIYRRRPNLNSSSCIMVEDLGGGSTLFRTEMRDCFRWDEHYGNCEFEDLDNSLQILRAGRWKEAIALEGRLIHDRSWVGKTPNYERTRFDGLMIRRNYRYFQKKWGLRLELRSHFLTEIIYPTIALTHFPVTVSQIDGLTRAGTLLRTSPRNWKSA